MLNIDIGRLGIFYQGLMFSGKQYEFTAWNVLVKVEGGTHDQAMNIENVFPAVVLST